MSTLLTVEQAAKYLGFKPATLNQYRWNGQGPSFFKVGRFVRYDRDDLDTWARSRRYTSTSEVSANARAF
jgi:excisionase family DNA binding protein